MSATYFGTQGIDSETMVPGWVMGKHKLCSSHKCTCLVPQHLLGYAQLLKGKGASLLVVFFTGGSLSGPLNSSTGGSMETRKRLPVLIQPHPGLILCPSSFQSPSRKSQSPVLEYPFPTSYKLELWESRSYLKVFIKEILYQILWITSVNSDGVFYALLGAALLSVKEEVNSLLAIASHWAKNSNLPQPTTLSVKEAIVASVQFSCSVVSNSLWPHGSWAIFPATPECETVVKIEKQGLINIRYSIESFQSYFWFYMLLMIEKCFSVYGRIFFDLLTV